MKNLLTNLKEWGFIFDFTQTNVETKTAFFLALSKCEFQPGIYLEELIDNIITKARELCRNMPITFIDLN